MATHAKAELPAPGHLKALVPQPCTSPGKRPVYPHGESNPGYHLERVVS